MPKNLITAELCLEAVKQWGWALKDVPENLRTAELCLLAVKQDGRVLWCVPENLKTEALCLEALKSMIEKFVPEALREEFIRRLESGK